MYFRVENVDGGCDTWEPALDAWVGSGALRDITSRSSGWRSDGCDQAARSGGSVEI
jgi:hypothetical protein